MQVFPEGAQDPLQRREEAGNEAKVPTLRGEDGYVSSEGAYPVSGLDRANTLFSLPLPRPWGAVCHQSSGKSSVHCPTVWKGGLWRVSLSLSLLGLKLAGWVFSMGERFRCSHLGYLHQIHSGHTPSAACFLPKREQTLFSQGFGHSGGQFGALRAFIVRMRLSLPPADGLLVGP